MNTFYTWDRIEQITDAYRDKAEAALREGVMFFPHALGFLADTAEENGLSVAVPKRFIKTRAGFNAFISFTVRSIHTAGRLEAGGFLALVPRDVAAELVVVGPARMRVPDVIAILHVEHVYLGIRTWSLDSPTADWVRELSETFTKIPTCLPNSVYGATTVGSA